MPRCYLALTVSLLSLVIINATAAVLYVDVNSASPTPPYTNWATAAVTIQDAVDAAVTGDQILVTNGVYQTGGRVVFGAMTNRVAVTKPVTVRSVNGPRATVIKGYQVPGTTNGDSAVRCVWLTNGAALAGFTLTNGATRGSSGDGKTEQVGGGVWCVSALSVISNCVFTGNAAFYGGGGFEGGTLNNCTLIGNVALFHGGGGEYGILNNCILRSNSSTYGGGAFSSALNNCTVTGNSVSSSGAGGGTYGCNMKNSIVLNNTASSGQEYAVAYGATINYCCTQPLPSGFGNLTNAPRFVDEAGGDLRLQSNSPCVNAGLNTYSAGLTDLDDRTRIVGGTVDMGAYEFQGPGMGEFIGWLLQFGLPTDGSADYSDSDVDHLNNWEEWIAGTNPTNSLSVLRLRSPTNNVSGVTVNWESVSSRKYFLERSADLGVQPPFLLLKSNIVGQAITTSYTDTNAIGGGPFFYRVGVQE